MEDIKKIAKKEKLTEEQFSYFEKVCLMYSMQKENIKPSSFHYIKYNEFNSSYLLNEIKKGKSPLDIMNVIIDECDKYSKEEIIKRCVKHKEYMSEMKS